jgi:hypothetical protein
MCNTGAVRRAGLGTARSIHKREFVRAELIVELFDDLLDDMLDDEWN